MFTATASIRWSMLYIWYLFLWMASFSFLEFNAILTDLSFFTVITTVLMNSSSKNFSNFLICLSSVSFWSLFSTFSRRCNGTLRPLCWYGVYSVLKIDFAMWFLERLNRVHRSWNTRLTFLPVFFVELRVIPSFASKSLPTTFFVFLFTIRTLQFFAVHDPDFMSIISTPLRSMLLLMKHL